MQNNHAFVDHGNEMILSSATIIEDAQSSIHKLMKKLILAQNPSVFSSAIIEDSRKSIEKRKCQEGSKVVMDSA